MDLRYGINPEQSARVTAVGEALPLRVISGAASYINVLDALNAWQLVREAGSVLGQPVATSFKHVSPAGAAAAGDLDEVMEATWEVAGADLSPIARAYIRARDCDPKCSFGDFVAVSEPVDLSLARVLASVVSDGIIAPGFEAGAAEILSAKKRGSFLVFEVDGSFEPPEWEQRELFGVRVEQQAARRPITAEAVRAGTPAALPDSTVDDLLLAMIVARYTQSNTITYAKDAMVLGVGAGQQSRVDCTKLAGAKVDSWWLRRHERVRSLAFLPEVKRQDRINWQIRFIEGDLTAAERQRFLEAVSAEPQWLTDAERAEWVGQLHGVSLASDGFIPFRDNIDQAVRHGVRYIADPGGSSRTEEVDEACAEHGITLTRTGVRLFHH
ncbi:MAG: cyclohydrolase [Acidimicrobiia bacterium]|nr:cyclohydrolase [Acidimicrobiia bacterium]